MIPGRMRRGWGPWAANAVAFAALLGGTQWIAHQGAPWNPSAWSAPGTGDVIVALASLLLLGLAFAMPLHAGVLNLGVYVQFLAGLAIASAVADWTSLEPWVRAILTVLAGSAAGALIGALILGLKARFAVHEVLSALLLAGALAPVASPSLGLGLPGRGLILAGVIVLAAAAMVALSFAHALRASSAGFDLRMVGMNPLAAVAAGVDVDRARLMTLIAAGACAGAAGSLQLWSQSSSILDRWPLPLGLAGITVAVYGMGSIRGVMAASALFTAWLGLPGTPVFLDQVGWNAAVAALLVLPSLWAVPRLLPDQGAPRALWRTRHRETY